MSLYYEASDILANVEAKGGSLKNRIFGKKDLKSSPGAIFALVAETTKWSSVLKEVVEKSDILKLEKKVGLLYVFVFAILDSKQRLPSAFEKSFLSSIDKTYS